jgi:hypothetical protein
MPTEAHHAWFRSLGVDPKGFAGPASGGAAGDAPGPARSSAADPPADADPAVLKIVAKLTELETFSKKLKSDGIGSRPLDIAIQKLWADLDAAQEVPPGKAHDGMIAKILPEAEAVLKREQEDASKQEGAITTGSDTAIRSLRDGAAAQIKKLADDNAAKAGLQKRLDELNAQLKEAEKIAGAAKIKSALDTLDQQAQTLFDDAAAATGDTAAKQKVYEKALIDKFGFTVSNSSTTPNTHLDEVYKMFERVPVGDVVQGSLKELTYDKTMTGDKEGAYYQKETALIAMGDYGAKSGDWGYYDPDDPTDPGKSDPQEGFSISALHELGHSVDDRWGIMAAHGGKPKCGGWRPETPASCAKAITAWFMGSGGKTLSMKADDVEKLALAALADGKTDMPGHMTDEADWPTLLNLLNECLRIRDSEGFPWDKPTDYGGRSFHQAYANVWWSYDFAARQNKSILVREYQWRAPGEFFAELYAYSWMKKKPAPSGVDAAITAYMYKAA